MLTFSSCWFPGSGDGAKREVKQESLKTDEVDQETDDENQEMDEEE